MKFCSVCSYEVVWQIPEDDNRHRYVCPNCKTVHYQNPRLITGTLPIAPDGRILLCRRNIEPRFNYWTLPAGFMENGETTEQGALRETYEEAKVNAEQPRLLSVISLPDFNQVHMFYLVNMPDFHYATTAESNAVELFTHNDIPWEQLAFRTVAKTLKHYLGLAGEEHWVLNDVVRPTDPNW